MTVTAARWEDSTLPREILRLLESAHSLSELADELAVTDSRVLWYLAKFRETGRVTEEAGLWTRTAKGTALADEPLVAADDHTVLPGRTAYDYRQAYADSSAGMFGTTFVQASGEHGGRVPHARVVEFNERLLNLISEYFAPEQIDPAATPKYGFHWILTPTDLHPRTD
jgi:hypothetical protein